MRSESTSGDRPTCYHCCKKGHTVESCFLRKRALELIQKTKARQSATVTAAQLTAAQQTAGQLNAAQQTAGQITGNSAAVVIAGVDRSLENRIKIPRDDTGSDVAYGFHAYTTMHSPTVYDGEADKYREADKINQ